MAEKGIAVEACPSSNVGTGSVKSLSLKDYPFKKMHSRGVRVSINTDNTTRSNTSVAKETMKLIHNQQITVHPTIP